LDTVTSVRRERLLHKELHMYQSLLVFLIIKCVIKVHLARVCYQSSFKRPYPSSKKQCMLIADVTCAKDKKCVWKEAAECPKKIIPFSHNQKF
jgi:hypothetical protein